MVIDGLDRWFSNAKKAVIVGVGNPIRRDDNVGIEVVGDLEGKVSGSILLIKSETVPESFIEPIIDFGPTHILIIDAALLGLKPGSVKFVETIDVPKVAISTHALPMQIFCEYLSEMTGAKIAMLLIQPKATDLGEGLTPELSYAKKKLVMQIVKIVKSVIN